MDLMTVYVIFALTTALVSLYELVMPVMADLYLEDPNHNMIEYKALSYVVFFLLNAVFAPFVIFPCLIPSMSERFKTALYLAITSP